jgi:hypothetical protein
VRSSWAETAHRRVRKCRDRPLQPRPSVEAKPVYDRHCERRPLRCSTGGFKLGVSAEYLTALHCGGILHDVGKIGIPDSILLKPGLTQEERAVMQAHPTIGERICAPLKSLRLSPIIRNHQRVGMARATRRPGRRGDPFTARILQVVDLDAFMITPVQTAHAERSCSDARRDPQGVVGHPPGGPSSRPGSTGAVDPRTRSERGVRSAPRSMTRAVGPHDAGCGMGSSESAVQ